MAQGIQRASAAGIPYPCIVQDCDCPAHRAAGGGPTYIAVQVCNEARLLVTRCLVRQRNTERGPESPWFTNTTYVVLRVASFVAHESSSLDARLRRWQRGVPMSVPLFVGFCSRSMSRRA